MTCGFCRKDLPDEVEIKAEYDRCIYLFCDLGCLIAWAERKMCDLSTGDWVEDLLP